MKSAILVLYTQLLGESVIRIFRESEIRILRESVIRILRESVIRIYLRRILRDHYRLAEPAVNVHLAFNFEIIFKCIQFAGIFFKFSE